MTSVLTASLLLPVHGRLAVHVSLLEEKPAMGSVRPSKCLSSTSPLLSPSDLTNTLTCEPWPCWALKTVTCARPARRHRATSRHSSFLLFQWTLQGYFYRYPKLPTFNKQFPCVHFCSSVLCVIKLLPALDPVSSATDKGGPERVLWALEFLRLFRGSRVNS